MKIVYQGVDYRQRTAHRGAAPLHMIEMQAQSKRADMRDLLPDGPITLGLLQRWGREAQAYGSALEAWQQATKDGAATSAEEPAPPDCALWLSVVNLFLTLRAGGWEGTLRDALLIPESELRYVREVTDGADAEDVEDGTSAGESPDPSRAVPSDGPATSGAADVHAEAAAASAVTT